MAPGKTELLLDLRGPGSLAIRRQITRDEYTTEIPSNHSEYKLRVVGAYKHLGTWLQTNGGFARDVAMKFAIAHDVMTRFRSQIFCNRGLDLQHKRQFLHSMVLSVVIFNAAVWEPHTARQKSQIDRAFFCLFRRFAVNHFGKRALHWNATQLYSQAGLPSPTAVLTIARLRYLG